MPLDHERLKALFGAESVGTFEHGTHLPPALDGVPVVSPPTIEAASEVLRCAARDGWRVMPAGAGEHLHLSPARPPVDLVLSTRRATRIVEYEPGDMVMVAEAGATLRAIDALAVPHAQRLGPDPWPGRAATVGGAAAANRAGPGRLRYGTWRDAVLGARVLHSDGRSSKTGGKVVKNVAGYDLAKLYVGSRGSLALLVEINLRLVPRPPAAALVVAVLERARAGEALRALDRGPLAPSSLLLVAGSVLPDLALGPDRAAACARFEGDAASVRWQVEEASRAMGGEEWPAERATVAWDLLRSFDVPDPGGVCVRISSLPVAVPGVLEALVGGPESAWGEGAGFVGQVGVGTSIVRLPGSGARALRALATRLDAFGARLDVELAPPGFAPPLARADAALAALLGRTKSALDPEGLFPALPQAGGGA